KAPKGDHTETGLTASTIATPYVRLGWTMQGLGSGPRASHPLVNVRMHLLVVVGAALGLVCAPMRRHVGCRSRERDEYRGSVGPANLRIASIEMSAKARRNPALAVDDEGQARRPQGPMRREEVGERMGVHEPDRGGSVCYAIRRRRISHEPPPCLRAAAV